MRRAASRVTKSRFANSFFRSLRTAGARGAARLGLLDVLTAAILLAILLWAAWLQFPAYEKRAAPAPSPAARASRAP